MNGRRYPYRPMTQQRGIGQFIITDMQFFSGYGQLSSVQIELQSTGEFDQKSLVEMFRSGTPISIQNGPMR